METINIIELLKRVKEGKAPNEIIIGTKKYYFNEEAYKCDGDVFYLYFYQEGKIRTSWFEDSGVTVDTKIKVLPNYKPSKPIIEELKENTTIGKEGSVIKAPTNMELMFKINEIIRYINKGSDIE